ncbi:hypothetical protein JKP88DRAFT_332509 [Tribonema minus]|uniref:ABC transporter domain-containing protein n=1 Tax=Tribonema minus TaxID=303371 RepID=A0A835YMY1_9STRA|nr:hypothetical protein JKP88DRAFT_332509 [Tribonema minus]
MLLAYTVGCAGVGLTIRVQNLHPVAIVGDSGAGKSCFLKCATNRTKPTSGSIAFTDDQGAPVPSHTFYVDRDFMYSLASRRHTVLEIQQQPTPPLPSSCARGTSGIAAPCAPATWAAATPSASRWRRRAPPRRRAPRATLLGLDELLDFADPRVRAAVEADVRRACAGGGGGGVAVMAVTHALDHAAALVRGGGAVLHWCGGEAIQIGPPEEVEYLRWKPQQAAQGRR